MKYTKIKQRLEDRIAHFEKDATIQKAIKEHPGCYKKPGSLKNK